MHAARKGPLRQFFGGLFAAVDFTRRLVVNAIFLLIVLIFAIAIFSGGAGPLEQKTTLVIDPQGAIVEQYTAEPLDRALGESLGDPVRALELLELLSFTGGGLEREDVEIHRAWLEELSGYF